jgi:hypothetical protein
MLNFVENLLENERGPMNDQDLTKTDYDPDRSLVLIEGLSHFLTNFLQNLASCQTSLTEAHEKKSHGARSGDLAGQFRYHHDQSRDLERLGGKEVTTNAPVRPVMYL